MSKFSTVAEQKVDGDTTAEFDLSEIGMPDGALIVAPASRSNKKYYQGLFTLPAKLQRKVASKKIDAGTADAVRSAQLPLYADHVVKGWRGVVGQVNGKSTLVPFSNEDCLDLLKALPNATLDALFEFCEDDTNFRDDIPYLTPEEAGEMGNGLPNS